MPAFDAKRPVESFKALVHHPMKGYSLDVLGLYMKDGTIRPLPNEAAVVGRIALAALEDVRRPKAFDTEVGDGGRRCGTRGFDREFRQETLT